jgi:hypothetical protein
MGTFTGKEDWRPYFLQFCHIANKYEWSDQDRLDKLIECLRDRVFCPCPDELLTVLSFNVIFGWFMLRIVCKNALSPSLDVDVSFNTLIFTSRSAICLSNSSSFSFVSFNTLMSVDFKIKIKNQIYEFDKLQEATEKKQTRNTEIVKRHR